MKFFVVFPAYAGVILISIMENLDEIGLSRVCGGDPIPPLIKSAVKLSFPRMRG